MTITVNDEEAGIIIDALESYATQAIDASQDLMEPDERYERADLIRTSVLATSLSVRIKNTKDEQGYKEGSRNTKEESNDR